MSESLNSRLEHVLSAIANAATLEALDSERVAVVGKSGFLTEQLKQLGRLPAEERKAAGEQIGGEPQRPTIDQHARVARPPVGLMWHPMTSMAMSGMY